MADCGAESVQRQRFQAYRITRLVGLHDRSANKVVMQQRKTFFLSLKKIKSTSESENFFSGRHYRCRRALRFASVIAAVHITT